MVVGDSGNYPTAGIDSTVDTRCSDVIVTDQCTQRQMFFKGVGRSVVPRKRVIEIIIGPTTRCKATETQTSPLDRFIDTDC